MTVEVQGEREKKERVESEAGAGEVERREQQLPPGWEWVWMQDPCTGLWERLRVPKQEADYRRREEIPPKHSYWGGKQKRESGEGD